MFTEESEELDHEGPFELSQPEKSLVLGVAVLRELPASILE